MNLNLPKSYVYHRHFLHFLSQTSSVAICKRGAFRTRSNTQEGLFWKLSNYGVFSCPYFPAFELNIVSLHIQSECGKIRTRQNYVFGHFSGSETINYFRKNLQLTLTFYCDLNTSKEFFKVDFNWTYMRHSYDWKLFQDLKGKTFSPSNRKNLREKKTCF